jgi:hypothetical protein
MAVQAVVVVVAELKQVAQETKEVTPQLKVMQAVTLWLTIMLLLALVAVVADHQQLVLMQQALQAMLALVVTEHLTQ